MAMHGVLLVQEPGLSETWSALLAWCGLPCHSLYEPKQLVERLAWLETLAR